MKDELYYLSRNHKRSRMQATKEQLFWFLEYVGIGKYSKEWHAAQMGNPFVVPTFGLMQFLPESHAAPKTKWNYGKKV